MFRVEMSATIEHSQGVTFTSTSQRVGILECKPAAGRDRGRLASLSTRGQLRGLDQYWQAEPLPRVRKPSCSHLTAIFPAHYLHGATPARLPRPGCSGSVWGLGPTRPGHNTISNLIMQVNHDTYIDEYTFMITFK